MTYRGQNVVNLSLLALAVASGIYLVVEPGASHLFPVFVALGLLFGVLLIIPIGGADMPTVISLLNSYAGLAASAMGFVLDNKLLIIAGALDGASGFILSVIMCKAMNRSFTNVLFGAFGQIDLGARNVEEVPGISSSQRLGFFGIDYVVGNRRDLRRAIWMRTKGVEWTNDGQWKTPATARNLYKALVRLTQ